MKNNLTIGGIWQDQRNSKFFELTAVNKENGKLQLSGVDEQIFTCMTESSLHKNYKLIAMSLKEFRPTTITKEVVTESPEPAIVNEQRSAILNEEINKGDSIMTKTKTEKVKKEKKVKTEGAVTRPVHAVQLKDGKIVSGLYFLSTVAAVVQSETWKTHSPIWYLLNNSNGQALLNQWEAKIVEK